MPNTPHRLRLRQRPCYAALATCCPQPTPRGPEGRWIPDLSRSVLREQRARPSSVTKALSRRAVTKTGCGVLPSETACCRLPSGGASTPGPTKSSCIPGRLTQGPGRTAPNRAHTVRLLRGRSRPIDTQRRQERARHRPCPRAAMPRLLVPAGAHGRQSRCHGSTGSARTHSVCLFRAD